MLKIKANPIKTTGDSPASSNGSKAADMTPTRLNTFKQFQRQTTMVTYQKLAEFDPLKDMRMMGKGKLKSVLECLAKPKEKRHEEEFEILGDLFKNSEL